jgi:uncharacterized protein (TIGR03083 family)
MDDPGEVFRRALDEFERRVTTVAADQWHLPTPCRDWDVEALVTHVVYEAEAAAPLPSGSPEGETSR